MMGLNLSVERLPSVQNAREEDTIRENCGHDDPTEQTKAMIQLIQQLKNETEVVSKRPVKEKPGRVCRNMDEIRVWEYERERDQEGWILSGCAGGWVFLYYYSRDYSKYSNAINDTEMLFALYIRNQTAPMTTIASQKNHDFFS